MALSGGKEQCVKLSVYEKIWAQEFRHEICEEATMGEVYVCGIWTVRPGEEDEFVQRWQDAASWATRNVEGVGPGTLFRDKAQPNRFLSFGPFDSMETVEAWRAQPEVQDRQAKLADVIENLERGIFEACVEVR